MSSAWAHQNTRAAPCAASGDAMVPSAIASGRETSFSGPYAAGLTTSSNAVNSSSVTISPMIMLRMINASVCSRSSPSSRFGWSTSRRYSAKPTAPITSRAKTSCESE